MYKQMYFKLFNAMSNAIEILQKAQAEAERFYIEYEEPAADDSDEKENGD